MCRICRIKRHLFAGEKTLKTKQDVQDKTPLENEVDKWMCYRSEFLSLTCLAGR